MQLCTTSRRINHIEQILVWYTVFLTFWSLLTGLTFWMGGFMTTFLDGRSGYLLFIIQILLFLYAKGQSKTFFPRKYIEYGLVYFTVLMLIYIIHLLVTSENHSVFIIWAVNGLFFISMRDDLKLRCFDRYARLLSYFLILAIIEYALYVFIGKGVITGVSIQRGVFDQYFDQLILNFVQSGTVFPRFQFLTEEPGLLGTACGLIIFALRGRPQYRIQYVIFIIAGLLTFSLAFYIIFALHLITSGFKFYYILITTIAIVAAYYWFSEFFDFLVLDRIDGRSWGEIDNRSLGDLDLYMTKAWEQGELWWGYGNVDHIKGASAGGKVWILTYGIVGVFLLILVDTWYYWSIVKKSKASLWPCIVFFLVFWISFYQRQNVTFLDYLIVFFSIPLLNSSKSGFILK